MKFLTALVSSIFLTAQAQEQAEVSCLTERRNSCSVCPVVLGETLSHDFTLCAGDCQVEGEGESRVCVPKAVNCGERRESECKRCPFVGGDSMRQDMNQCNGDCEVKHISVNNQIVGYCDSKGIGANNNPKTLTTHMESAVKEKLNQDCVMHNKQFWGTRWRLTKNILLIDCKEKCKTTSNCNWFNWNNGECEDCQHKNSCFLFSSKGTISKEGKGRFSGGVSSAICGTSRELIPTEAKTYQNSEEEATSVLTSVKMEITNPNIYSFPPLFSFFAEVCVESRCCTTGVLRKRSGVFTFSENFRNLGNCGQLRREQNEGVTIKARTMEQTDLQIMKMEVQFDDGTLMVAENPRSYWRWRRTPLAWGVAKDMTESSQRVGRRIALPESQCPEDVSPSSNACPKANVRVHARLPDAPKFCYYQVCETFSSDLSLVGTGELGTGGYCVPEHQMKPQYQYCCDLQQYFTTLEEEPRPSQDIAFPRCNIMNYTRTDI